MNDPNHHHKAGDRKHWNSCVLMKANFSNHWTLLSAVLVNWRKWCVCCKFVTCEIDDFFFNTAISFSFELCNDVSDWWFIYKFVIVQKIHVIWLPIHQRVIFTLSLFQYNHSNSKSWMTQTTSTKLGSQALKFLCISVVTMMKATFAKHGHHNLFPCRHKDESD